MRDKDYRESYKQIWSFFLKDKYLDRLGRDLSFVNFSSEL